MRDFRRTLRNYASFRRVFESTPARHKEPSIIVSADDEFARPTKRLLDVALGAIGRARSVEFRTLARRTSVEPRWHEVWPGEHYKLLAGLVAELGARNVVEIGTSTGMGTLAIAEALPPNGAVTTFDIAPWRQFQKTWLIEDDFSGGRIAQEVADVAASRAIGRYRELFQAADFIFIDGPKDGVTELRFIEALASLPLPRNPVVMFDDIRVLNMIEVWRRLNRPKLDITSFGHWSGTGLVDWNGLPSS
jgi:predicted O-methyltransferase YrrM